MTQTYTKEIQQSTWLGRKGNLQGTVKRLILGHAVKLYMHKPEYVGENKTYQFL